MTIAAGFRCSDGVLLCADSQLTIPQYLKMGEAKIISMAGIPHSPCFVYAGDVYFSKDSIHRLATVIGRSDTQVLTEAVRRKCRAIYREQAGGDRNTLELLLTLRRPPVAAVQLWHICGTAFHPVQDAICIGAGMDMMHALTTKLYRSSMTLREASYMAAYALSETKEYVDSVGKNSLIYLLFDSGKRAVVVHEEIQELERSFEKFWESSVSVLIQRERLDFIEGLGRLTNQLKEAYEKRVACDLYYLP